MGEILNVSLLPKNKIKRMANEVNCLHSFNFCDLNTTMAKRSLEVWEIRLDQSSLRTR